MIQELVSLVFFFSFFFLYRFINLYIFRCINKSSSWNGSPHVFRFGQLQLCRMYSSGKDSAVASFLNNIGRNKTLHSWSDLIIIGTDQVYLCVLIKYRNAILGLFFLFFFFLLIIIAALNTTLLM